MFDVGFSEVLLIGIIALVAIGPKDLPQLLFRFGRLVRRVRIFMNGFRDQYSDVMHQVELDHYRKEFEKKLLEEKAAVTSEIKNDDGRSNG